MSDLAILTPGFESSGIYAFVEEINMCIETFRFEYIGDLTAGQANGNNFIGTTSFSAEAIVDILRKDIVENTNGYKQYNFDIRVKFAKGIVRDIIVIDIDVYEINAEPITLKYEIR